MTRVLSGIAVFGVAVACVMFVTLSAFQRTRHIEASRESQAAQLQCGHWCVYRCSWLLGAPVDMKDVARMLPPDPDGHSLKQLRDSMQEIGFKAEGYSESFDDFRKGRFPCIVHLQDPDHFVLAVGPLKMGILVFDGSGTRQRVREATLKAHWTGNLLRITRNSEVRALPGYKSRDLESAPCVQFKTLHIDKGDVPISRPVVSFVFPFVNHGPAPLRVANVHTDCKCIEASKPKNDIPPGGEAEIVLTYHARNPDQKGKFSHEAVVESNDPIYPLLPLRASGNTDVRVTYTPQVIDFEEVVPGTSAIGYCFIRYVGEDFESFHLDELHCSVPGVETCDLSPLEYEQERSLEIPTSLSRDMAGLLRIVKLTYTPSTELNPSSDLSGTLEFETNVEDIGQISVPVKGAIVLPLAAIPQVLDFGELRGKPERITTASVTLRSFDRSDFHVVAVGCSNLQEPLDFSLTEAPRGQILEIACSEEQAEKCHKSTIDVLVQMSDPEMTVTLPLPAYAWSSIGGK